MVASSDIAIVSAVFTQQAKFKNLSPSLQMVLCERCPQTATRGVFKRVYDSVAVTSCR